MKNKFESMLNWAIKQRQVELNPIKQSKLDGQILSWKEAIIIYEQAVDNKFKCEDCDTIEIQEDFDKREGVRCEPVVCMVCGSDNYFQVV